MTTTTAAHTIGMARLELPLRGESLAAWLNSRFIGTRTYRKTERTLFHSDAFSRSPSCRDGEGCAALTGSEAGKLSIRPASSRAWISWSAKAASRGLAACRSCAAGSNFSAMLSLHGRGNAFAIRTFPSDGGAFVGSLRPGGSSNSPEGCDLSRLGHCAAWLLKTQ
jgi:hypothetical protein